MKKFILLLGRLLYCVGWPGIHLFLEGTERTRLIVECEGKYLEVKPYLGAHWMLPGGGVERSETASHGAARELFEEVGIRISPDVLTKIAETAVTTDGHHYKAIIFGCRLEVMPVLKLRWWEIAEARWVSLDVILGICKTSPDSERTSTDLMGIFSGGSEAVGSATTEKWSAGGDSRPEAAGILRKSSTLETISEHALHEKIMRWVNQVK